MGVTDGGTPPFVGDDSSQNMAKILLGAVSGMGQAPGGSPLPGGGTPQIGGMTSTGSPTPPALSVPTSPGGSPLPQMTPQLPGGVQPQSQLGPLAQGPGAISPARPQTEFRTKAAARNQNIREGMHGLMEAAQVIQKHRFDKGVAAAKDASLKYMKLQEDAKKLQAIADAEQDPEKKKTLVEQAQAAKKKADEFLSDPKQGGKALKDSNKIMSPAYIGVQQAGQERIAQAQQQTEMESKQALAEKQRADALKAQAQAAREDELRKRTAAGLPSPDVQAREAGMTQRERESQTAQTERTRIIVAGKEGLAKTSGINKKGPELVQKGGKWYEVQRDEKGNLLKTIPYPGTPEKDIPVTKQESSTQTFDDEGNVVTHKVTTTQKGLAIGTNSALNPYKGISPEVAAKRIPGTLSPVDYWARWVSQGMPLPRGTNSKFATAVSRRIASLGLPMNAPPSPMAASRAAAAVPLVKKDQDGQNLFDKAETSIRLWAAGPKDEATLASYKKLEDIAKSVGQELDPKADGDAFISRWKNVIQQEMGTLSPQAAQVQAYLTSIYSFTGSFHGWRALQVAQALQKDLGSLRTNPAATMTSLETLRATAELVAVEGNVGYRMEKMQEMQGEQEGMTPSAPGQQRPRPQNIPNAPGGGKPTSPQPPAGGKQLTIDDLRKLAK